MHHTAAIASAFVAGARRDGLEPARSLRLLRTPATSMQAVTEPAAGPHDMGARYAESLPPGRRRREGVWYTPAWLATELAGLALAGRPAPGLVVDPACGGGAFLIAVADALVALGHEPAAVLARLRGVDTDRAALAVAEAALWWWGATRGVADGHRAVSLEAGDALLDVDWAGADLVIGNPPFAGQLRRSTAVDAGYRHRIRARFGGSVGAYTDPSALFMLAAVEATRPGGRVLLLQPQSFLGGRDAGPVRRIVEERGTLTHLWVEDAPVFEAAVAVCAPVIDVGTGVPTDWVGPLADARGVPSPTRRPGNRLGDVAAVHAGFRDEYYGLVDAVREGSGELRLVTAGAIDPFRLHTGRQRFARGRWDDPRVTASDARGKAKTWVATQRRRKILVATQTKVLEAVDDAEAALLGSVPVLAVVPDEGTTHEDVLAALHAPSSSAWMLRRSAGTALSSDACKPTAALLADLPLPADRTAWSEAVSLSTPLRHGSTDPDDWRAFGLAADRAYGVHDPSLTEWWIGRLPRRCFQGVAAAR